MHYCLYLPTEQASCPLSWIKVCNSCELPPHWGRSVFLCGRFTERTPVRARDKRRGTDRERQSERCVSGQTWEMSLVGSVLQEKMINGTNSSVVMLFCLSDTVSEQLLVLLKASYQADWPHVFIHVCTQTPIQVYQQKSELLTLSPWVSPDPLQRTLLPPVSTVSFFVSLPGAHDHRWEFECRIWASSSTMEPLT